MRSSGEDTGTGRLSANQRNVSVGEAVALLRAAAEHPDGASVSQLPRSARIPRATALQMIVVVESEWRLTRSRRSRMMCGQPRERER